MTTATEWANVLESLAADSDDVILKAEGAVKLATLLRAMVAEREALFKVLVKWPADIQYPAAEAEACLEAKAARRRAEGGE
jgi:hypothetical protein